MHSTTTLGGNNSNFPDAALGWRICVNLNTGKLINERLLRTHCQGLDLSDIPAVSKMQFYGENGTSP